MKKFTLLFTVLVFTVLSSPHLFAQTPGLRQQPIEKCGTMLLMDKLMRENPDMRIRAERARQDFQNSNNSINNSNRNGQSNRLTAIVTIPVVVHIVTPNPFIVTDADVQAQLNRLNLDYSGLNPDSTNIPAAFQGVRGHSQIRFCLAQRTPGGQLTNGIERRTSNTFILATANDPVKSTAAGGLDAWDPTSYLNIWVGRDGTGLGLLGYATFPGTGALNQEGVAIVTIGFSNNTCYVDPFYNLGRTLSHEVGHYFGLFHNFGTTGGCTDDDFSDLSIVGSTCVLPAGLPADDTPPQGNPRFGCPSGTVTDACSGSAPGVMYQNIMDYTDDACMTLFTNAQVARMEAVIDACRPGLKTSLGCSQPAGAITLDASPLASVNPGGFEITGCTSTTYPSTLPCAGSIVPKFRVVNNGAVTITSLTAGYTFDNGPAVTQNVVLNLPTGATAVITFPAITVPPGTHTFKFFTSNPNGGVDLIPANDTLSTTVNTAPGTNLPITEGFESTTFPPPPWIVVNPNGNFTWVRRTPGRNSAAAAFIDNYNNNNPGQTDDIRSPSLSSTGTDSVIISFDLAHKFYPFGTPDSLSVLVSTDCGITFTTIYKRGGAGLATAGSSSSGYTAPVASDWRTERIAIGGPLIASGNIVVVFRNHNRYGNNIWIDNINIEKRVARDIRVEAILKPAASECSPNIIPQVLVRNSGSEAVTQFKVGYSIDGGPAIITTFNQTINAGGTATVTLPVSTAAVGNRSITVFTADPVSLSGTGDQQMSNDTLTKAFIVNRIFNSPITVDFETPEFPPANWTLINPNNNVTWQRQTPGRNSQWSMFINNYDNNLPDQIDELKSPPINVTGADSIIFKLDVAAKYFSATLADTLSVLVSTDCGSTFTAVYKRVGPTLGGVLGTSYTSPIPSDWRTDRIGLGGAFLSSGNVIFSIRNTNRYGNNIFIDNINIDALFKRDIAVTSINSPAGVICSPALTPTVTIKNVGVEAVTAFKVSYSLDGGAVSTTTVTGVNIPRDGTTNVTLTAATVTGGNHIIRIYSWDPVTASGTGDQNTGNDTLTKSFSLVGSVPAPLTEGFESTTFPPANWAVVNPDGDITWARSSNARTGTGSAFINTYNYTTLGEVDELWTPQITLSGVDSITFSFDLAAVTYSYPGSTGIPLDTLEILASKDCGNTFTRVYKKWGEDLQTIDDPNTPQTDEFRPNAANQWRRETIDLTSFGPNGPLQIIFRATSNFENNIYIDNVSVTTRTLPARLKTDGYLILPNPFQSQFSVWHYRQPTNLKYVSVYNASGQLVWSKQFNTNAEKLITIDLSNRPAGIYTVNLGYEDSFRNVSSQIIKY